LILRLPLPPSVNAAYGNRQGPGRGRYKTAAYKAWLVEADKWLLKQKRGLVPVFGPAMVCVRLPMKMRGDVSNRIKVAEDFLVSRRLTSDDKNNLFVGAVRAAEIPMGECEIVVRAA
jgi:hypothetical protein